MGMDHLKQLSEIAHALFDTGQKLNQGHAGIL
jgi:hypothetical protein